MVRPYHTPHLAQESAYGYRAGQVQCDLRMAADERDSQFIARVCDLLEGVFCLLRRCAFRQQECGHEPLWGSAHYGKVVGVYLDHVPADQVCGERDGIGLCHQVAVADVYQSGVFAELGAEHDPGIADLYPSQQVGQETGRQLAGLQAQAAPRQEFGGR